MLIQILYASTSGHTEYVVEQLAKFLQEKKIGAEVLRAEKAQPEDLLKGDVLVLATSTWNTGNTEGQLNPHMYHYLLDIAKDVELKGKKIAVIGLGDERYHYTCRAADHMEKFVEAHGGELVQPTLRIVNEPYGQEAMIRTWGEGLLK